MRLYPQLPRSNRWLLVVRSARLWMSCPDCRIMKAQWLTVEVFWNGNSTPVEDRWCNIICGMADELVPCRNVGSRNDHESMRCMHARPGILCSKVKGTNPHRFHRLPMERLIPQHGQVRQL